MNPSEGSMWFEQKNQLHQPNLDKFMEKLYDYLPQQLVTFILVTLFSLLIGLSQRRISLKREGETTLFGTDRTFTFIGILGYLLYILDPKEMHLFKDEADLEETIAFWRNHQRME